MWLRALMGVVQGDAPTALHDVERCLAISPSAGSCLRVRATLEASQGECAALEADARRMVTTEVATPRAYDYLATALFAQGDPVDSVTEALRLKWHASPDGVKEHVTLLDEADLAIATGDFPSAMKDARAMETLAESSGNERSRLSATVLRINLHDELGEPVEAATVADADPRRMRAWPDRDAIGDDPRPILYATATRGGLRTADERDSALREWIATWSPHLQPVERASLWLVGYAIPAETREDAEKALVALKDYSPVPPFVMNGAGWTPPTVGKVYSLAGRAEDALPSLRLATKSCSIPLANPISFMHSELHLAQALEASGDVAGACDAYGVVLARWGSAKQSVTVATASARARVLGCVR